MGEFGDGSDVGSDVGSGVGVRFNAMPLHDTSKALQTTSRIVYTKNLFIWKILYGDSWFREFKTHIHPVWRSAPGNSTSGFLTVPKPTIFSDAFLLNQFTNTLHPVHAKLTGLDYNQENFLERAPCPSMLVKT